MLFLKFSSLLIFQLVKGDWNLVWNDEFDNDQNDFHDRWHVVNEHEKCGGTSNSMDCKTNSTENMWLINGTLALTAVHRNHRDKSFTSAQIVTREAFNYSKIEIRAALPVGSWLRPSAYLVSSKSKSELEIVSNLQSGTLTSSYKFEHGGRTEYDSTLHDPYANLNNFHLYTIQWNDTWIIWSFDNKQFYYKLDLRKLGKNNSRLFTEKFNIMLNLEVGGNYWTDLNSNVNYHQDADNWTCSLLMIDYVRVYKWSDQSSSIKIKQDELNMMNSSDVCEFIMPQIRNKYVPDEMINKASWIIIMAIIMVIGIMIFLAIFNYKIFTKSKKIEKLPDYDNEYRVKEIDDDIFIIGNNYQEVDYDYGYNNDKTYDEINYNDEEYVDIVYKNAFYLEIK